MSGGRVHAGGACGPAVASVIVTWPDGTGVDDVEEAVKAAAREAIRRARTTRRQRR